MPRIYDSASDPIDYCRHCWPGPALAARRHDTGQPDGPDGRGNCYDYDSDHPSYADDPTMYRCHNCSRQLTERDDEAAGASRQAPARREAGRS